MPVTGAQHFPDLCVREFVEEGQCAQQIEMFLVIEAVVFGTQVLINARQVGRQSIATWATLVFVFLHRRRHDFFEFFRKVAAIGVNRRWCCVHDLVQQLRQVVGAERPEAGQ